MKIYVWNYGDRSVGIPGDELTIDWPGMPNLSPEERVEWRKGLQKFWTEYMDFKAHVRFDDECSDCGSILDSETQECRNPNCIRNLPDEESDEEPDEELRAS